MTENSPNPERFSKDAPKMLIMNYPNNPTGLIPDKKTLEPLAKYFRENNWFILSDEIYILNLFNQENFYSLSDLIPERTIVLGGISKWGASGGWRVGFAAVPSFCQSWVPVVNSVISETISCVPAPIQFASVEAFRDSQEIDNFIMVSNSILKKVGLYTADRFRKMGADVWEPQGAFYLFPDFSSVLTPEIREKHGIHSGEDFQNQLFDIVGFAILPGSDFQRDSTEMSIRVSFIDFEGEKYMNFVMGKIEALSCQAEKQKVILEILNNDFWNKFAPNIVEGLDKFEKFINNLKN